MINVPTEESLTEPALYGNSGPRKRAPAQLAALPMARPRPAAMLRRNVKNVYGSDT